MRVGFAGLGLMGQPMAANLCRAGVPLTVYNRSIGPRETLRAMGAAVAESPEALFERCDTIILMLADDTAVDGVLRRRGSTFGLRLDGRLVINMGTHSPAYSEGLARDVTAAGGVFVEAPVSGSRGPAQSGELVAMLAGPSAGIKRVRPLLQPLCSEVVEIGQIPSAMAMKLAVNLYLIASVTVLAEATHLAAALHLDLDRFQQIITRGPLGSVVAQTKLDKMVRRDFTAQASIRDVLKNADLVARTAALSQVDAPLLLESLRCFEIVRSRGGSALDMAAVLTAYEPAAEDLVP